MRGRCRLGFDEETKRRLSADYAERGRGPIRQENCRCGRLVVAESIGGAWLPRPHYPPSPYKSRKKLGDKPLNPSDQGP
jgi:hypothetical protein